tara:strand:+ start:155900 stop:156079 length:180 start_codon:yes stop_codon:yes gene_type:complete
MTHKSTEQEQRYFWSYHLKTTNQWGILCLVIMDANTIFIMMVKGGVILGLDKFFMPKLL